MKYSPKCASPARGARPCRRSPRGTSRRQLTREDNPANSFWPGLNFNYDNFMVSGHTADTNEQRSLHRDFRHKKTWRSNPTGGQRCPFDKTEGWGVLSESRRAILAGCSVKRLLRLALILGPLRMELVATFAALARAVEGRVLRWWFLSACFCCLLFCFFYQMLVTPLR